MKVLICGSRFWHDSAPVIWILTGMAWHTENLILVEGDAKGADQLAGDIAAGLDTYDDLNIEVRTYPADWEAYGKAAGPIRNRQQFDKEQPDVVIGFSDDIQKSRGTKDMLNYAKSKEVPVYLVSRY